MRPDTKEAGLREQRALCRAHLLPASDAGWGVAAEGEDPAEHKEEQEGHGFREKR